MLLLLLAAGLGSAAAVPTPNVTANASGVWKEKANRKITKHEHAGEERSCWI